MTMSHYTHNDDEARSDAERSLSDVIAELRRKREGIEAGRDITRVEDAPPPVEQGFPPAPSMFAYHLRMELIERENALLDKNRKYGNSALEPMRVFSRSGPVEQLDVRIDDKLSRIRSRQDDDDEDAEEDLLGYLLLKRVAKRMGIA